MGCFWDYKFFCVQEFFWTSLEAQGLFWGGYIFVPIQSSLSLTLISRVYIPPGINSVSLIQYCTKIIVIQIRIFVCLRKTKATIGH